MSAKKLNAVSATRKFCNEFHGSLTLMEIVHCVHMFNKGKFKTGAIANAVHTLSGGLLNRKKGTEKGLRGKYYYSRKTPN